MPEIVIILDNDSKLLKIIEIFKGNYLIITVKIYDVNVSLREDLWKQSATLIKKKKYKKYMQFNLWVKYYQLNFDSYEMFLYFVKIQFATYSLLCQFQD